MVSNVRPLGGSETNILVHDGRIVAFGNLPEGALGLQAYGIDEDCFADLVLIAAETVAEAVAQRPGDRLVVRRGRLIAMAAVEVEPLLTMLEDSWRVVRPGGDTSPFPPAWIGRHKEKLRSFAEALAAAVPEAIGYETLKMWRARCFVSEASVDRLLKAQDLITSSAFIVVRVVDEFHTKITPPNQLWLTDFTYFKVIGSGFTTSAAGLVPPRRREDRMLPPTLKNGILLENYCLPGELDAQVAALVEYYKHKRTIRA